MIAEEYYNCNTLEKFLTPDIAKLEEPHVIIVEKVETWGNLSAFEKKST